MFDHLKAGMLFYEIGTSDGWQAAFYASMVGGSSNMVLIEPTIELWPNVKLIWEQNNLSIPKATYAGFCGDHDSENGRIHLSEWPEGPDYSEFMKGRMFSLFNEPRQAAEKPCRKIDTLAEMVGMPGAINIDVEGAELLVLRGAEKTLKNSHPIVWLSVHPEMIETDFGQSPKMVHEFMEECGYKGSLLSTDHEEHWFYTKRS